MRGAWSGGVLGSFQASWAPALGNQTLLALKEIKNPLPGMPCIGYTSKFSILRSGKKPRNLGLPDL